MFGIKRKINKANIRIHNIIVNFPAKIFDLDINPPFVTVFIANQIQESPTLNKDTLLGIGRHNFKGVSIKSSPVAKGFRKLEPLSASVERFNFSDEI